MNRHAHFILRQASPQKKVAEDAEKVARDWLKNLRYAAQYMVDLPVHFKQLERLGYVNTENYPLLMAPKVRGKWASWHNKVRKQLGLSAFRTNLPRKDKAPFKLARNNARSLSRLLATLSSPPPVLKAEFGQVSWDMRGFPTAALIKELQAFERGF